MVEIIEKAFSTLDNEKDSHRDTEKATKKRKVVLFYHLIS